MNSFKGIWIPIELIEEDLTWTKRILLAEISQLEMLEKGCLASNRHFSEKLKITPQGISKAINELAIDGYIIIDNAQTKRNFGRSITINYGKSPINHRKSSINCSLETKDNIPSNKTINNNSVCFSESQIDEIYSIYPKKRGKHEGYVKLKKIKYSEKIKNQMIKQIEQCKKEMKDKKFHRGFSAWVNQRGWEDLEDMEVENKNQVTNEDLEKLYGN